MRLYEYSVRKGIRSLARFITNPLRGLDNSSHVILSPITPDIQQPYSGKRLVSAAKQHEV